MEFDFSQLENYVAPELATSRWFVEWYSFSNGVGIWREANNWNPQKGVFDRFGGHTSEIMAHAHAAEARRWRTNVPEERYRVVRKELP